MRLLTRRNAASLVVGLVLLANANAADRLGVVQDQLYIPGSPPPPVGSNITIYVAFFNGHQYTPQTARVPITVPIGQLGPFDVPQSSGGDFALFEAYLTNNLNQSLYLGMDTLQSANVGRYEGPHPTSASWGLGGPDLIGHDLEFIRIFGIPGGAGLQLLRAEFWGTVLAPPQFTVTAPPDAAVAVSPGTTLAWQSAAPWPQLRYRVEVASNEAMTNLVFQQADLATPSVLPPAGTFVPASCYFWRVTAYNNGVATTWTPSTVRFSTLIPGDFDRNGAVEFTDLNAVLSTYGARIGDLLYNPLFDLDQDGQIGFTDLNVVLSFFGWTCP